MKPLLSFVVIVACVLSGPQAKAQTDVRILNEPWEQGHHWAETLDQLWFTSDGHFRDSDTQIEQFWWDSNGRVKLDRDDPDPRFVIGYRILTSSIDTTDPRLPGALNTIALVGAYRVGDIAPDWSLSVTAGGGTSNDNHFDNGDSYFGIGAVNVRHKIDAESHFDFGLDYDGNRNLFPDVPLPYVSYSRQIGEDFSMTVGLPSSKLEWKPVDHLRLEAAYEFPLQGSATVSYELTQGWSIFADYHRTLDNFARKDLDDSLFYSSSRTGVGVRYLLGKLADLRAGVGYTFDQDYRSGFDIRQTDEIAKPTDGVYFFLNIVGTF